MSSDVHLLLLPSKLTPLYLAQGPKRMDARWKFGESSY